MRVLITGANGFVGKVLSSFLLGKGFEVFGMDKTESTSNNPTFKLIKTDITNEKEVVNAVSFIKPDIIFHLAAISSIQLCENNPSLARKVNVDGTRNLLSACLKFVPNVKLLLPSTSYVYGVPKTALVDEKHPIAPVNEYGKSKLEQENVALEFLKKYNLKIIISRSFNHIGPGQETGFVCSDFAKQIAELELSKESNHLNKVIKVGNIDVKRNFTDVRDVIQAYLLLVEKGQNGEIYNVGSCKAYFIRDILLKLLSMSKVKISIEEDISKFRKSEVEEIACNNSKLVSVTGWKPKFTIEQSLRDVLDDWRERVRSTK